MDPSVWENLVLFNEDGKLVTLGVFPQANGQVYRYFVRRWGSHAALALLQLHFDTKCSTEYIDNDDMVISHERGTKKKSESQAESNPCQWGAQPDS